MMFEIETSNQVCSPIGSIDNNTHVVDLIPKENLNKKCLVGLTNYLTGFEGTNFQKIFLMFIS